MSTVPYVPVHLPRAVAGLLVGTAEQTSGSVSPGRRHNALRACQLVRRLGPATRIDLPNREGVGVASWPIAAALSPAYSPGRSPVARTARVLL